MEFIEYGKLYILTYSADPVISRKMSDELLKAYKTVRCLNGWCVMPSPVTIWKEEDPASSETCGHLCINEPFMFISKSKLTKNQYLVLQESNNCECVLGYIEMKFVNENDDINVGKRHYRLWEIVDCPVFIKDKEGLEIVEK